MAEQAEFPRFTPPRAAQNRKTAKPHRCALVCAKRESCVLGISVFKEYLILQQTACHCIFWGCNNRNAPQVDQIIK